MQFYNYQIFQMKIRKSSNTLFLSSSTLFLFTLLITLTNTNQEIVTSEIKHSAERNHLQAAQANVTLTQAYKNLNQEIQSLDQNFIQNFISLYHLSKSRLLKALNEESMASQLNIDNIKGDPGNYLLLLGKMYLYDILPKGELTGFTWSMYQTQSRFMLAYFYLKVAAQRYENAQAYYYLALLDYYKVTPHETFLKNLENEINRISKQQGFQKVYDLHYNQILEYLRNQRFVSVEQNLFLSSMIGHHGSSLALAHMFKEGIGLDKNYKNCTTALSYYLSVIKDTYVDYYEFRSSFGDQNNFQKELYAKRKVVFQNQQNVDVVSSSQFFDSETIKAMYELAENYFIGRNGFEKNYVKAAELYAKLASQEHKNSLAMLGMCYFKGQGVPIDRKKAKVLFQRSSKLSISEAMLIVMDYFEIQSKGNRPLAIKKMREIYDKKKENMNPILKYLFATLVIKGDLKSVQTDDAILLLAGAAKDGHLMAKIAMGLLFADGIDVNFDCPKAVNYFSEQALSHPFFMDKYYMARLGLKSGMQAFSLIKYLELTIVGDTNSFINALYILEIENEKAFNMNLNSWNIKLASENSLYKKLKQQNIVPDIYSQFQKQYSFLGKKPIKYRTLERLFEGRSQVLQEHQDYIKKKIIKVCAVTKENNLMNFYEYKMSQRKDASLLNSISNGSPNKLHVLQARYLLGQHYHKKSFQALQKGKENMKQQYRSLQEYKRATNSPILGKILFYIQQIRLNPLGIDLEDQIFRFRFINDLLTYTFVLSILTFVLYYKRSKKLDQIHQKELEKRQDEIRIKEQENQFRNKSPQRQNPHTLTENKFNQQNQMSFSNQNIQTNPDQPEILEERPLKGYRIGSSQQDDPLVLREVYDYEIYKFQQKDDEQGDIETHLSRQQQNTDKKD